jgi:transcriptional regulator with XRE-family HTH domain
VDRQTLIANLRNKAYRDEFVAAQIDMGIPFQIRAMRERHEMSQQALAELTGMAQARISLLERPGYGRLSLSTLKRLASAFDVALVVRFIPFSQIVDWTVNLSPESLTPPSFDRDPGLHDDSSSGAGPLLKRASSSKGTGTRPISMAWYHAPHEISASLMGKATGSDRPLQAVALLTPKRVSAGSSIAAEQPVGAQSLGGLLTIAGQGAR